jgi:tetratricopeptide (TPR) repeat protein
LVNRFPENNQFCQKLAASFSNLGDVSWVKTNVSEALEYHKNAFELSQKLFEESPDDNELRVNVGRTQSTYARMLGANGHLEQSLENAHLATKLLEEANSKDPENKRTLRELGISYDRISEILLSLTDKYEESLEYAIKSNEVFLKIVADDRSSPVNRRSIAVGFLNISEIQGKLGKFKLALENGEQSLLMFKELLREDEQNEEFRGIVAVIDSKVSDLMVKTGNASQAIERLKNSLSVCEQLIAKSPADEILEFRLANIFESLGNAFGAIARQDQYSSKTIDLSASCSYFRKSYDIYKRFKDAGKTVGDDAAKVDIVAAELAKCETQLHK